MENRAEEVPRVSSLEQDETTNPSFFRSEDFKFLISAVAVCYFLFSGIAFFLFAILFNNRIIIILSLLLLISRMPDEKKRRYLKRLCEGLGTCTVVYVAITALVELQQKHSMSHHRPLFQFFFDLNLSLFIPLVLFLILVALGRIKVEMESQVVTAVKIDSAGGLFVFCAKSKWFRYLLVLVSGLISLVVFEVGRTGDGGGDGDGLGSFYAIVGAVLFSFPIITVGMARAAKNAKPSVSSVLVAAIILIAAIPSWMAISIVSLSLLAHL